MDAEVVVVGTGAAGVSAARPLVAAGLDVLMLDPDLGRSGPALPDRGYLDARRSDPNQHRWLLARSFAAAAATSPKFRAPTLTHLFVGFAEVQRVATENFSLVGSLASGGLTSAWGAGVATFSAEDMSGWPITRSELDPHYRSTAARIGVSGSPSDDLDDHFGLTAPALPLDAVGRHIEQRYERERSRLVADGFRMGRARLAVLAADRGERSGCAQRGLCLWGCPRRSIYSAAYDLNALTGSAGARHRPGTFVEAVVRESDGYLLRTLDPSSGRRGEVRARTVVLAAGAIGSARLAIDLAAMRGRRITFRSTPTAAIALLIPALFGRSQEQGTGLAQHWYVLDHDGREICGGLFPTTGLPLAEFVDRSPFSRRLGIDVMRWLLPAMTVGNLFADGRFSDHSLVLGADGTLHIRGGFAADFPAHIAAVAQRLRPVFRRLGAFALPGSFTPGEPGSDVHYAGTLPMRAAPGPLETSSSGELSGAPGVYVVDGSVLPSLPPKSHTLTIMANAERIAAGLARRLTADRSSSARRGAEPGRAI